MRLLCSLCVVGGLGWLFATPIYAQSGASSPGSSQLGPEVSVTDPQFGAKCDGSTGDAAAIQAAVRYGQTKGVAVNFPNKTCVLDKAVNGDGGTAWLNFHDTILVQTHAGWGITLAQSAVNTPIVITGEMTFIPWSVASGALKVIFPQSSSVAQSTFDVYGKINCYSVKSDYYIQCLELDNAWNAIVYGLNYNGPLTGNLPVAGTSAVAIGGSRYAGINNQFYNLNAFSADAALWLKGYTEGVYLDNPQAVNVNWGVRVGTASVDASNAYQQGPSNITAQNGIYCNLIQIIGGELNTFRSGIMADRCQQVITRGTHFFNAAYDNANPYRAVVLNDTSGSSIDGYFEGSQQNKAGEAGVLIVKNNTAAANNRVRGTVEGVLTGVSLGIGTSDNDVQVTRGAAPVPTPISDNGTNNQTAYNNGSTLVVGGSINARSGLQDNGNRIGEVLLSRQSISNAREIAFTGLLTGSFNRYRLSCDDIRTASGAGGDVVVVVGQSGPPRNDSYAYSMWSTNSSGTAGFARTSRSAASVPLNNSAIQVTGKLLGQFDLGISSPSTASTWKPMKWSASFPTGTNYAEITNGNGFYWGNANAITDLQVWTSSGNFASMTCALYGDN